MKKANIVLLGAPGSGKGTQAHMLHEHYGFVHISTGDIFRDNIHNQTELGNRAKVYIDDGKLVPDEITVEMVKNRLSQEDCVEFGYILDGFPRTHVQAQALMLFAKIDWIINIDLPLDYLMMRLTNRRTCASCHAVYNLLSYNKTTCEECGGELVAREDDKPATVLNRLEVYKNSSEPIIAYYESVQTVHHVDGKRSPKEVFDSICAIIDQR
ncbi:MAG: adenylate kinase [Clostridia bacterium]|nr:adenylate kinase [Clostridia bacterium]